MKFQDVRMMSVLGGAAALLVLAACEGTATSGDHDDIYVNEGQADAITSPMLVDGSISNVDVAGNAAIAGTKINPNFGDGTIVTNDNIGVGTDEPDYAIHVSRSGPEFIQELGLVSQPTVLIENVDDGGMPDEDKFPGVAVANYGKGHPYILLAAANGSKDDPEAFQGPRTFAAWIGRAWDGEAFVEGARVSYVAESSFAPGVNPTTIRFELGDNDPQTPEKSTKMVLTSEGRLGVGNPSPQATLDVAGFARLTPFNAAPALCDSARAGSIALTSEYSMCACNGTQWVFTHSGAACAW